MYGVHSYVVGNVRKGKRVGNDNGHSDLREAQNTVGVVKNTVGVVKNTVGEAQNTVGVGVMTSPT